MALIDCPKCEQTISDRAVKCPHCGANFKSFTPTSKNNSPIPPQSGKTDRQKKNGKTLRLFLFILLGLVVVGGIGYYFYEDNHFSSQNYEKKYENYTYDQLIKLANDNDCEAMTQLGRNALASEDYTTAFKWWIKAADMDYPVAQNNLGFLYQNGLGVTKNDGEAFKWFLRSAKNGFSLGQYNLASCYFEGIGTNQSEEEGLMWIKKSAEGGEPMAMLALGFFYQDGDSNGNNRNEEKAEYWLKECAKTYKERAERGDVDSQALYGKLLINGYGVSKNYDEGIRWMEKSAQQGNSGASDFLISEGVWAVATGDSCTVASDCCRVVEESYDYVE